MSERSASYPDGAIFQVEVWSPNSACWIDRSEHATLESARESIGHAMSRSSERREWRVRKFVVAELIEVTPVDRNEVAA